MNAEQFNALNLPFLPNEVQWRLTLTISNQNGLSGLAVPYLDSRAIQYRLDSVVGYDNWKNEYQVVMSGKNDNSTAHICTISIYNAERNEWISKSNGAGDTDIEAIKGGLSDAFKRAASMWGIGRYLYEFEGIWVNVEQKGKSKFIMKSENAKLDRIYNETVKKLFPKLLPVNNNTMANSKPPIISNTPLNNNAPVSNEQKSDNQKSAQSPCFIVKNAEMKNDFTQITMADEKGKELIAYFKGNAHIAKNQRIINANIEQKNGESGKYYIMRSFSLAA